MKFFADTAEITEIRTLPNRGLLDGVTTNPSLIHKSGRDFSRSSRKSPASSAAQSRPRSSRSIMMG